MAHLARQGVAVEPIRVDESTGKRFTFFADPDGNALMLHHRYLPRTPEPDGREAAAAAYAVWKAPGVTG